MPADRLILLNIANPSRILSMSPDGADLRILVEDCGVAPDGLAVDRVRRHLFWTYMGTSPRGEEFKMNDGRLERIDVDGGNRTVLVSDGSTFTPKQMYCDDHSGFLYWCEQEGMRVMRAELDGSHLNVLVQTGTTNEDRQDGRRHCVGIAVDRANGYLYWTQKGRPAQDEGRILRVALRMPPAAHPRKRPDIEVIADHLAAPDVIAWEPTGGHIYWIDRSASGIGHALNRSRITPGRPIRCEIIAAAIHAHSSFAVDADGARAFVSDVAGYVRVVSLKAPHEMTTIFSGEGPITGIAYVKG